METVGLNDVPASNRAELKGWNWGAFGLTWIWGIAHRTPISLLVLVPVLGWFGMPVVLGLKGNQWAWQNRNWRDLEAFQRHQRRWAKAALISWLGVIVAAVVVWKIAVGALTSSAAFQLAQTQLRADPKVGEALGTPLTFGTPSGSVNLGGGGDGSAKLKFSLSGPHAQGTAFVEAHRAQEVWSIDTATIQLDNGSQLERVAGAAAYQKAGAPAAPQTNTAAASDPQSAAALQPLAAAPPAKPPLLGPTGVLSDASVRKTAARHHGEVRFCMEQEQTPSSSSPRVHLQFVVDAEGHVDTVDVSERSDVSERLEMCLIQALKRWKFQAPTGGSARASLLLKR